MTEQTNNPYERPKPNLISRIKLGLSWFERRKYNKIVEVEPQSEDMAAFQKLYKDIYELGNTLHIRVDATRNGVEVPEPYVQDGKIVLDISPRAIAKFQWVSDGLKFSAAFGGKASNVQVPFASVLSIYNLETQLGVEIDPREEPGQ